MTTNDDEIKWEIERLRIHAHEQIPLAYKEEVDSRIQQAIDLARADEREQREQREQLEKQVAEIILDLVCQYAYTRNEEEYFSDGLSVLEDAFIWLIGYGYADGDASHIKLTDKALAFWRANENKRKR